MKRFQTLDHRTRRVPIHLLCPVHGLYHRHATLSINRKNCIRHFRSFSTMGFHDPLSRFPDSLESRFSMSQFTDMVPYVLALLAELLAHVTTISQGPQPYRSQVFGLSKSRDVLVLRIHDPSNPICRYNDSGPTSGCFSLCRDSRLRNSEVYGLLVHGIPDFPMDDFPFGTFPACSDCLPRVLLRWMVLIASHDFGVSAAEILRQLVPSIPEMYRRAVRYCPRVLL